MSELSDKIRAITLAFNEREITRSMKESRFLREINRSRKRHNLFAVGNTGESFSVAEDDSCIPPNENTVQLLTRYKTLFYVGGKPASSMCVNDCGRVAVGGDRCEECEWQYGFENQGMV